MNLKIEDLLHACKKCRGTGEVENPVLSHNLGSYGQSRPISATPDNCDECGGKGIILTESGKTLLEFFRLAKQKNFLY
jgi:hypothetical protein